MVKGASRKKDMMVMMENRLMLSKAPCTTPSKAQKTHFTLNEMSPYTHCGYCYGHDRMKVLIVGKCSLPQSKRFEFLRCRGTTRRGWTP